MTTNYDRQVTFDRLKGDPRLREIIDNLKAHSGDDVFILVIRALAYIQELFGFAKSESLEQKTKRRQALAKQLRTMANDLNYDPQACWFRITDPQSIFTTPIEGDSQGPKLSEYLKGVAEVLNTWPVAPWDTWTEGKRTTRMDLKSFAKREVWSIIKDFSITKSSPNAEVAEIVNILLELPPSEQVKANDIANMSK